MRRFSNILLVANLAADYSAALQRAITLAKNNQAALTICTVIDATPAGMQKSGAAVTPAEFHAIAVSETRDQLDGVVRDIAESGISIATAVLVGKPFIKIIRQVLRENHDLVIKSVEGAAALKDILFGSTDMHLMRKCPCPVWIIKPTEGSKYRRILAAVDQDPEDAVKDVLNRQILEMSASLAMAEFSELHIVHAWRLLGEDFYRSPRMGLADAEVDAMVSEEAGARRRWVETLWNTYITAADQSVVDCLSPQLHVIEGDARHIVPATAADLDVDLVVMGTVARTGIPGFFMGNTAESILTQIDCSVLTIKPPGFVSPVGA